MGAIGKRTVLVCTGVAVFEMTGYTITFAVQYKPDWKEVVLTNVIILILTFVIGGALGYVFDLDKDP